MEVCAAEAAAEEAVESAAVAEAILKSHRTMIEETMGPNFFFCCDEDAG